MLCKSLEKPFVLKVILTKFRLLPLQLVLLGYVHKTLAFVKLAHTHNIAPEGNILNHEKVTQYLSKYFGLWLLNKIKVKLQFWFCLNAHQILNCKIIITHIIITLWSIALCSCFFDHAIHRWQNCLFCAFIGFLFWGLLPS